jgi:5-methylcytosine-specific restriction endonuclease McrA
VTPPAAPSRRTAIVERDGATCVWCGREPWPRDLTLEHLLPRSRGGHGTPENLTPACRPCNRARRSRPVAAYVRELIDAGREPRLAAMEAALRRLASSSRAAESAYGARQLDLLRRLPATR